MDYQTETETNRNPHHFDGGAEAAREEEPKAEERVMWHKFECVAESAFAREIPRSPRAEPSGSSKPRCSALRLTSMPRQGRAWRASIPHAFAHPGNLAFCSEPQATWPL